MTKNIGFDYNGFFATKHCLSFYWPRTFEGLDQETVEVEYLDIIESYLWPLQFGMRREDFIDFYSQNTFSDIRDFLRYKRYVSTKEDLDNFFCSMYPDKKDVLCYEIEIKHIGDVDILAFRNLLIRIYDCLDKGEIMNCENVTIKYGKFDIESNCFREVN